MAEKFTIYFQNVISGTIEVTADDWDDALEKAIEEFDYPGTNIGNEFEIDGEWEPVGISTLTENKIVVNHDIQETKDPVAPPATE